MADDQATISIYHYKIFCVTEQLWKDWYLPEGAAQPTTCPTNTAHTVNENSCFVFEVITQDQVKDAAGKALVHQTSCPFGYVTGWFGEGDDIADPTAVGGGVRLICDHAIDGPNPLVVIADLNIKENGSYIHEGYLDCLGGVNDYVHAEVIPVVTPSQAGSNTNFNSVNGVIIAAAGDGTLDITGTMKSVQVFTDPNTKIKPAAYWNFDYDTETHEFSNPAFVPTGDGNYNLFASENVPTIFPQRFWHAVPALGNTSKWLQSADAVPLGSNMRIRAYFHTHGDDHAWHAALTVAIHRTRLI